LSAHLAAGAVFELRDELGLRAGSICEVAVGWDAALLHHLAGVDVPALIELAQKMRRVMPPRRIARRWRLLRSIPRR